ncbi:MAG: penicillin-binding transpeptidase domain-containing protein [Phycisphaerae bacterium]
MRRIAERRPEAMGDATERFSARRRRLVWAAVLVGAVAVGGAALAAGGGPRDDGQRIIDLSRFFEGYDGCFVLLDLTSGEFQRFNPARCDERLSPCSTFKIPHALIGLETGVLKDEHATFRWDGSPQPIKSWQGDHTLASAIKHSVLWYFQRVAAGIGPKRMQTFVDRMDYGNRNIRGGITTFWLDRDALKISANEQAAFLAKLYRDELPFQPQHMETVRRLLVLDDDDGTVFSGKTGSSRPDASGRSLGWFIGHVKTGERKHVFATIIRGIKDASGRHARWITKEILRDLKLMDE